ncbi:MAG: hypothetical protein ABTQ32_18615 [Myxococcaceae bacterium]
MTREVPPFIDAAMLRGTVKLRWQDERVSELVVRWDPNLFAVGAALFTWAATEALDALWLDGASLFSGTASLASRLGSVRRLCLNTTPGDVIDLDWVSAHARQVERFVSVEGEFSGGASFPLATSLDLASTSPRFCALAQCPRVVDLSLTLGDGVGLTDAHALVVAFPTVRTLCTRVEDLETARLLAPVFRALPLSRWVVEVFEPTTALLDGATVHTTREPVWQRLLAAW